MQPTSSPTAQAEQLPRSSEAVGTRWSTAPEGGLLLQKSTQIPRLAAALRREAELVRRLPEGLFASVRESSETGPAPASPGTFSVLYDVPHALRMDDWLASGARPPPSAALRLCRALARCVAALHAQGHADRHLGPARFFLPADATGGEACLAELGRLSRPATEELAAGAVAWIEGDLSYLAPEQTGRMNRSTDHRSDLYTLGVLFYRILTGRLPFTGADDLALVHAQLSLPPPSPRAADPTFPVACERLLFKLLEKHAEDRYQTAAGLCADLDVLVALDDDALAQLDFTAGMQDHGLGLQIPQRLYGRDAEVRILLDAFRSAAAGARVLLMVAGYSGVGKSALINEIHKPITAARGSFIAGKFDQYQRDLPYVAVLGALRELLELVLAESQAHVEQWRVRLLRALEGEGAVMLELLPELARLTGPLAPLSEAGPAEAAARQKRVFQKFIRVFARPEHPLVLFLGRSAMGGRREPAIAGEPVCRRAGAPRHGGGCLPRQRDHARPPAAGRTRTHRRGRDPAQDPAAESPGRRHRAAHAGRHLAAHPRRGAAAGRRAARQDRRQSLLPEGAAAFAGPARRADAPRGPDRLVLGTPMRWPTRRCRATWWSWCSARCANCPRAPRTPCRWRPSWATAFPSTTWPASPRATTTRWAKTWTCWSSGSTWCACRASARGNCASTTTASRKPPTACAQPTNAPRAIWASAAVWRRANRSWRNPPGCSRSCST